MPEAYSFTRYVRLYTLHTLEQTAPHPRLLQARITTVQYVLQQLPTSLDADWNLDAQQGVALTRALTVERIDELLGNEARWAQLLADASRWQPYQTLREQSAVPTLPTQRFLPTGTRLSRRIAQAERLLQLTQTAIEVANAGLVLWQSWRRFRDERLLLQDSVSALIERQEQALDHALDPGYVQHYLQECGDDPAYDVVFGDEGTDG